MRNEGHQSRSEPLRGDASAFGLAALLVVLTVGFPKQFRRSLGRWFGDEPPAAPAQQVAVEFSALATRIKRLIRPTLLLVPTAQPGFSKLGGDPELPADVAWPEGRERPGGFLAQIDLAALAPQSKIIGCRGTSDCTPSTFPNVTASRTLSGSSTPLSRRDLRRRRRHVPGGRFPSGG